MDTGTNTFIYEDSKEGTILDSYSDTFLSDAIILAAETDSVYSPQVLKYLELLGDDIRNERYVLDVKTPADIIKSANNGVIPNTEAEIRTVAAKLPDNVRETYFESNLLTITTVRLEPGLSDENIFSFINNLETLIELSDPPAGVKITVSGESAFSRQMQQEMGNSMRSQIALTMILMIAALAFLFSYVRYRFLPIVVIAFGVVVTFGIMVIADLPVSMPVIGSFPVIIGLGIDYAVQ
ncbi:MAG: MMPL family transporter, partial [Methanomicrobium sp.]|nr:MMPL family transporter [Methanomicrobium sp.]